MPRTTLGDARNSRIPVIIDLCKDDARVAAYVNQAQRWLLDNGRWWGTYQEIQLCLTNCQRRQCLTFPREVASVEAIIDCRNPAMMRNQFYEYLDYRAGQPGWDCAGGIGSGGPFIWPWGQGWNPSAMQRNTACTFDDIIPPNKGLRVYPTNAADVGKTITFFVQDGNGIPIVGGITVTLALPFADALIPPGNTVNYEISTILDVQKQVTLDRVLVYELNMADPDPSAWTERQIAIYEPGETRPEYIRYLLRSQPFNGAGCCRTRTVRAIVKLGYIEAVADTDYLSIGNLDALELMCEALRAKETGQTGDFAIKEKLAIKRLNQELRTRTGDRVSVGITTMGPAPMQRLFGNFC